jgi:hypothetical protein
VNGADLPRVKGLPFIIVTVGLCAACDMGGAEVLDAPRVLAVKVDPASFTPGGSHALEAFGFDVEGEFRWAFCPTAWAPTEPLSCPVGAVELGAGNPLTVDLPAVPSGWLKVEAEGALPAVKKLEAEVTAENPRVRGLVGETGPLPEAVAPLEVVGLKVDFEDGQAVEGFVVSWYVTAGTLEPQRTLGSEVATLEMPEEGEVEVIAVIRESGGGTAWARTALKVEGDKTGEVP